MAVRRRVLGRGERVHIHAPGARDRDELLALACRSRTLHRTWIAPPRTPDAFAAYLARLRTGRHAGFLVRRNADGALLGLVNLNEIVRGSFQSAYLGYWIGAPFARQGYMGEGLALVLRHAFGRLRLHRVEANVQPANVASAALVRRLGFRKEGRSRRYLRVAGRWRDHDRFALLAEEWRPVPRG
jgi:ribosomal-protein-alanine N-acetyltransferase